MVSGICPGWRCRCGEVDGELVVDLRGGLAVIGAESAADVLDEASLLGNGRSEEEDVQRGAGGRIAPPGRTIYHAIGDLYAEAAIVNNLGNTYRLMGRCQDAMESHRKALAFLRAVTGQHDVTVAVTLHSLGDTSRVMGGLNAAIEHFTAALEIHRSLGNHHGEAITLHSLGETLTDIGELAEAERCHIDALTIQQQLGQRTRQPRGPGKPRPATYRHRAGEQPARWPSRSPSSQPAKRFADSLRCLKGLATGNPWLCSWASPILKFGAQLGAYGHPARTAPGRKANRRSCEPRANAPATREERMSRALTRTMAACVATAATAAALVGGPAYAAGPATPVAGPTYLAKTGALAATTAFPTGTFMIFNRDFLGHCVGIAGPPPDGPAGDWNCDTASADQIWHVGGFNSDGFVQLVNGRGQCLGVAGGSDNANAQIVGWECLGPSHPDQYWAQITRPDGLQVLVNDHGWFDVNAQAWIIGVSNGSGSNGAPLVLWPDTGAANQEWSETFS